MKWNTRFQLGLIRWAGCVALATVGWLSMAVPAAATSGSGGVETSDSNYVYHTFLADGTFTVASGGDVEVLVVAGGGGGGGRGDKGGGGGGAGGLIHMTTYTVTGGASIPVTVGIGGAAGGSGARGTNGGDSQFDTLVAVGGGGGAAGPPGSGTTAHHGKAGGSGGGGSESASGGAGTPGQGFAGGRTVHLGARAGGGGGAGGPGEDSFSSGGGVGLEIDISGAPVYYAGGGAGGDNWNGGGAAPGGGGLGGGGGSGVAGTANTGGGGGGGLSGSSSGGAGGSGIVILRYAPEPNDSVWLFGGDITDSGSTNVIDSLCVMISVLLNTFTGGPAPVCLGVDPGYLDFNCDGSCDVADVQLSLYPAQGVAIPAEIDANGNGVPDTCD